MLTHEQRQIVKKARDRIAEERSWCQGMLAQRADNTRCDIDAKVATKFCAVGALAFESLPYCDQDSGRALEEAINLAMELVRPNYLDVINDRHGHVAVLEAFDSALAV